MTAIMTRMLGVFLNVVGDSFSSLSLSLSLFRSLWVQCMVVFMTDDDDVMMILKYQRNKKNVND